MSDLRHRVVGRAFLLVLWRRLRSADSRAAGGVRFAAHLGSPAASCGLLLRTGLAVGCVAVAFVPPRCGADSPPNEASSASRRARKTSSRSTDNRRFSGGGGEPA